MADELCIEGLSVSTQIGVPEEERQLPQRLEVSIRFPVENISKAAASDSIDLTIDYAQVAECLREIADQGPRLLIETLAEDMTKEILTRFPIKKVELEIRKFILPDTRYVSLKIQRVRN